MTAAGVEPDAMSYDAMLHACGVKGAVDEAEHWLKYIKSERVETCVVTFAAVIQARAGAGTSIAPKDGSHAWCSRG